MHCVLPFILVLLYFDTYIFKLIMFFFNKVDLPDAQYFTNLLVDFSKYRKVLYTIDTMLRMKTYKSCSVLKWLP